MATLRLGSKGDAVKKLQYQLGKVLNRHLLIDGDFGQITEKIVKIFQKNTGLYVDGVAGPKTQRKLKEVYATMYEGASRMLNFKKPRFAVFVDAGHGGIDDSGRYVTPGKRAYHKHLKLHDGGHYYEGYENRIITEMFIEACSREGIMCVRTYHPYKDTALNDRTQEVRSWLRRGYYGYLHSFHSNAIASSNTPEAMKKTRGFGVYTTRGNTLSDEIAEQHFKHVKSEFIDWRMRPKLSDGDSDREANFTILKYTDMDDFEYFFGSILEEFGFHTSSLDAAFITKNSTRRRRVECALRTARWTKRMLEKRVEP